MLVRRAAVWSIALVCLPLMAACKNEPVVNPPTRQRGVWPRPADTEQPAAQLPARVEPQLADIRSGDSPAVAIPATTPAEEAAPDEPEKPPRNLQNELETMMGSPASCLGARPASEAPANLNIALSASIMPSGTVGRGEVSAPGLTPDEVTCVRSRLESLRFAQPIENAPLTVSGTITLNQGS
jgi:hypothetical protein